MEVGRITVKPGKGAVTLYLAHWATKADATLSLGEAKELVQELGKAIQAVADQPAPETRENSNPAPRVRVRPRVRTRPTS